LHALAGEDFDRAACLLERAWRPLNRTLSVGMLVGWMDRIPDRLMRARPVLCVGYAWALLSTGEMEAGERWLQAAERWLATARARQAGLETPPDATQAPGMVVVDDEQFRALPATIAAAHAYRAQALGNLESAVEYSRQALELVPEHEPFERGVASALLGLAYWESGNLESAHRTFAHGIEKCASPATTWPPSAEPLSWPGFCGRRVVFATPFASMKTRCNWQPQRASLLCQAPRTSMRV
ncbi:MAG: hypothetical protein HC802_22425, partial [Caldilineaceae bacterium]|nr:hypothetical protein [Caldilineaceae bacterium]